MSIFLPTNANSTSNQDDSYLKKRYQLPIVTLLFLLGACSHFDHHSNEHDANHSNHQIHHDSDHSVAHTLNIKLNDDKKWLMDAHTRAVTLKMQETLSRVHPEDQTQSQLIELGTQLSDDLNTLIQGCTMEGDAHNALHEFLTNFMPAVAHLKEEGKLASAKRVQYLLNEYRHFFE